MAEAHFRLGDETQPLGRVWRDLGGVKDNLCSRMHDHYRAKTAEHRAKGLRVPTNTGRKKQDMVKLIH